MTRLLGPFGCAAILLLAAASALAAPAGLVVRDGVLMRGGRPFVGIGVNYFDCFYRTLIREDDTSYRQGFRELAARKVPFVRFMCGGFWPSEMKLYTEDRPAYFRRLDAVVRTAEREGVGLIPSLFWNASTVPDVVGEPCDQWGNPHSKTIAFMRTYTREVVSRYRRSPAIWGWEFGNEYNLSADLPNASEHRPGVHPELGTPTSRSGRDDLTHAMIRTAFREFGRSVRALDRDRVVITGNGFPRPTAWHQLHTHDWADDSPEQREEMLRDDNPDPTDTLCVHAYDDFERIPEAMRIARRARKPLFVGEFGVPGPPTPEIRDRFARMLAVIVDQRVPFSALWVFDRPGDDTFGVAPGGPRAYQLDAIAAANTKLRAAQAGAR